jgi:hypothetical protein
VSLPQGRHAARILKKERVTAAYIYMLLRLPWLAPVTTAIVNGRQPQQLSAKTLMRKASRLPADWTKQRTLLRILTNLARKYDSRALIHMISLWTRHCSFDCNQKSKPRNGAAEIFVSTGAEITRAIRLCRKVVSHEP